MKNKKKKLIVIGIDGGNFEVINSLKDKLPNLHKIPNKAVLYSTMPPGTAVSWASFLTGNSPGKTGIYDFTLVDENSWKIKIINRKRLKSKPMWEYLDKIGVKSCFFNIPVTYPPDEINGIMVSGIDAPSTMSNYVTPSSFKSVLKKFDYEIEVSGIKDKKDLVSAAISVLDKRIKVAKHLLKKDFDFISILFRESDVAQHFAWGKQEVETCYTKIDEFIGHTLKYAEKNNCNILIMSDHGEEPVSKAFNVNSWLEKNNYLATNIKRKSLLSKLGISRERIFHVLDVTHLGFLIKVVPRSLAKKVPTREVDFEEAILTKRVNMNKTKAIGKRTVKTAQIFFNTEDRGGIVKNSEKEILVQEIKNKLNSFLQKNKIKAMIMTKEELYPGAQSAPDLTVHIKERGYDILTKLSPAKKIWDDPREKATHAVEGIIFTDLNLDLNHPRIIDLAPTILSYFGIKKGDFDGKSILK